MTERVLSVLLTFLLVMSVLSPAGVGAASAATGNSSTTGNTSTFHVMQGANCYEVSPLGSGDQSVSEFYDYQKPQNTNNKSYTYSSHGTKDLQENQVSNVFVYNGTEGYSLVTLHDKLDEDEQDAPYGSTITFEFSNMSDVTWEVRDDNYTVDGAEQDDNWDIDGPTHRVDWMWKDHRTDGGAFSGIVDKVITITPQFNEDAPYWGETDTTGNESQMTKWLLLGEGGTNVTKLNMDQQMSIASGSCPDGEDTTKPSADLTADPNPAGNNEQVTLDASNSSDEGSGIDTYKWDFDGDGKTDETTTDSTITHTYTSVRDHDASVTVVDENGNEATASVTVTVEDQTTDQSPTARATANPDDASPGETVTFDGGESTDAEGDIASYTWEFGDGTTKQGESVTHAFSETGTNTVTLTVEDSAGNTDTAEVTVSVETSDAKAPDAALSVSPNPAANDETVTLDASNSSGDEDSTGIATYEWDFDGDGTTDHETSEATVTHTYSSAGSYDASVTVVDGNGNADTATETVTVQKQSSDAPPTARLEADDWGAMSHPFEFDASESTDDNGIQEYRWDFDSDGTVEWVDDSTTSIKPYRHFDKPGTYQATVTVVDASGQTDTATVTFKVKHVYPTATIDASSSTVEVGEDVTFTATDFNEDPDLLAHVGWEVDGETEQDGRTWTTSFDETGQKTVTLVLEDLAENRNVVTKNVTVTADQSGGSNPDDSTSNESDPSDSPPTDSGPNEGGLSDDDDDDDSKTGSVPSADPDNRNDGNRNYENQNDGNTLQSDQTASAPLSGDGAGTVVVTSNVSKAALDVTVNQTAPASVEPPTPDDEGFEALSYVNVTGADGATVTVSKDRLTATEASADAVSLFRFENGSWTAVETTRVETTEDSYRFSANATDGTYAVGVDRAATSVTDVSVSSRRAEPGESVTVTATVENAGRADGTTDVQFTVGGEVVASQTVSVDADTAKEISFEHTFDSGGVYELNVGDAQAELVVEGVETDTRTSTTEEEAEGSGVETSTSTTTNDSPGVPGFGVGVSLVALLAAALLGLRRR